MAMLSIPTRLKNLIDGISDEITAAVGNVVSTVAPILKRNETPFFPDYTDHGIEHIESVLRTCEIIMSEEAWQVFTREDAAALVLAVITHDIGMMIDFESFQNIVTPSNNSSEMLVEDDIPWNKLWRDYMLEVKRFDASKLINLTGSPEPIDITEIDSFKFSERSTKIVGEFLRRHHHRLSHEIIMLGKPSANARVDLFKGVPEYLKSFVGLIARSHGISLRKSIDLLTKIDRNAHRAYRNVHPIFIMALVRISDYLDLDISRAPGPVLATKSLKSPISRREWWSHRAVVDCHVFDDDPESLYIAVQPQALSDVMTFTVVEEKITGIQRELDACWAVTGEVYGRFPPLNNLSIKIRRVKSDLRQTSITSKLQFVPYKASLESARADLLKLLIGPLYGNHPGIGIRELIQNSIDAVRELEYILKKISQEIKIEREELGGDIVVALERDKNGGYWVAVADKGVGMTWQTIKNFFLTAGASFRQSDAWKNRFTDDSGSSRILRSGRFGIGVLAAFLIGNRVQVMTRHAEEPEDRGVQFEFGLNDINIEMKWIKRKVGTTIKVKTTEAIIKELMKISPSYSVEEWDWYCLKRPKLVRIDLNGKEKVQKYKIPGIDSQLPDYCHRISVPRLQAVDWTFSKTFPRIACNGIKIPMGSINTARCYGLKAYNYNNHLYFAEPNVSIYDSDGVLPINLSRDKIDDTYIELSSLIADDICRNFLAFSIIFGPKDSILENGQFPLFVFPQYPGFDFSRRLVKSSFGIFFSTKEGFGLTDSWNLSKYVPSKALLIKTSAKQFAAIPGYITKLMLSAYKVIFGASTDSTLGAFDGWHRSLVASFLDYGGLRPFSGIKIGGLRCLMPLTWFERFLDKQVKYIINIHRLEYKSNDWAIMAFGDVEGNGDDLIQLSEKFGSNKLNFQSLTEVYMNENKEPLMPGQIAKIWKQTLGAPIIPFDTSSRQDIADKLDESFARHLIEWRRQARS